MGDLIQGPWGGHYGKSLMEHPEYIREQKARTSALKSLVDLEIARMLARKLNFPCDKDGGGAG
jgi:hypothetical protein